MNKKKHSLKLVAFSKQNSNNNNFQLNNSTPIFETQNKSFNHIPAVVY